MLSCKKCGSDQFVKNGFVAGKQRYKCKMCPSTFREGDNRTNAKTAAKKALCILFYAMAKGSFRNSDTRHHLARFTRRTKVVSKCEKMVDLSLRIWHDVTTTEAFQALQKNIVSIFKSTLSKMTRRMQSPERNGRNT